MGRPASRHGGQAESRPYIQIYIGSSVEALSSELCWVVVRRRLKPTLLDGIRRPASESRPCIQIYVGCSVEALSSELCWVVVRRRLKPTLLGRIRRPASESRPASKFTLAAPSKR